MGYSQDTKSVFLCPKQSYEQSLSWLVAFNLNHATHLYYVFAFIFVFYCCKKFKKFISLTVTCEPLQKLQCVMLVRVLLFDWCFPSKVMVSNYRHKNPYLIMNWNGSQLLKQTKYAKHKGVTEAYISAWIKRDEVSLIKWKLDLKVL